MNNKEKINDCTDDAKMDSFLKKRTGKSRPNEGTCNNNKTKENHASDRQEIGNGNNSSLIQEIFGQFEAKIFIPVLTVRVLSICIWTLSILYATYRVFLACEEHLAIWFKDPVMNPGPFSGLLNRGKDSTDYEWEMFITLYFSRLWIWYGLFAIASRTIKPALHNQKWMMISLGLSIVMFSELLGFLSTVFILLQPFIYWMILKTRSKLTAWTATLFFIYNLNSPITQIFIPDNTFSEYFFVITSAWNYARCISFCYDVWDKLGSEDAVGLNHLLNITCYCFYLPLALSGPLVTYESFEKNIINKDTENLNKRDLFVDVKCLLKKITKIGVITLMNELILHFLYFRALSLSPSVHKYLSLWAVCGTIYWLGQFFAMKYKVLYGVPTALAEFDGMEMPPLPTCPSYIHRYSMLWRDFDAGLYRFLVRYIYIPILKYIQQKDTSQRIPADVQKLLASFASYVYVFIWHSLSFDVFIWTALNFLGITIERIGSVIKKLIDNRMPIRQIYWDFVIEPIVTVPLAGMSILNSSIFCGSMTAAVSFSSILWDRRRDNWVFLFLYFFTHTAVTHRTWRHKLYNLFSKMKRS